VSNLRQQVTKGIVLSRINYAEADRILTILSADQGKLRLIAKGVRKIKSKLAGGVELFSVSDITYVRGKGDIGTLISARLIKHYDQIVGSLERVQLGYDLLKIINQVTEDYSEPAYFDLLEQTLVTLDDAAIDRDLINCWFKAQLLKQAGHMPNLQTDTSGQKLKLDEKYSFDIEEMTFRGHQSGNFTPENIKILRLLFSPHKPDQINRIVNFRLSAKETSLVNTMFHQCISAN
jgi:DNA repair protein RecO (recombination protein O)